MRSTPLSARLPEGIAVWLGYVAVGVGVFFPLVTRLGTHILADDVFIEPGRSDAYNFLWTYWWIQKAALSGENLYHCSWVLPPTGANLYFHTHVILPTLLTLPLGLLWGPVGGYNSMIVLMLSGAATVYYLFLRRTFGAQPLAGFVVGALFGFSPYFVFKTHAHLNLVGGVFWAGALAVLVHAHTHQQFSWRQGAAFSLLLWATFWTSFVEFFALVIVCVTTTIVFVVTAHCRNVRLDGWAHARFIGMVVPGAISLLSLLNAPDVSAVDVAPFPDARLSDLLIPARLSILGGSLRASEFEYWGSHVPIVFVILAVLGLRGRQVLLPVLLTAAMIVVVVLNPFGAPLALLRQLPFGTGFRVAGRFLPFCYFFALVPAAFGLQRLLRWQRRVPRAGAQRSCHLVLGRVVSRQADAIEGQELQRPNPARRGCGARNLYADRSSWGVHKPARHLSGQHERARCSPLISRARRSQRRGDSEAPFSRVVSESNTTLKTPTRSNARS